MSVVQATTVTAIIATAITSFNGVAKIIKLIYDTVTNLFIKKVVINTKDGANSGNHMAILQELADSLGTVLGRDGADKPHFEMAPGIYVRKYGRNGVQKRIFIWIEDDEITLYAFFSFDNGVKDYLTEIYKKYNNPEKVMISRLSQGDKWGDPQYRRLRDMDTMIAQCHPSSLAVLNDVEEFFKSENEVRERGRPFRYGLILSGEPGTGKTAMTELIAMKFQMITYNVILNSDKMNDSVLINMVTSVPPRSLIIFDEFEKQLETIKTNKNINLSEGGILSAIDGPQRLSHGTIVIATVK